MHFYDTASWHNNFSPTKVVGCTGVVGPCVFVTRILCDNQRAGIVTIGSLKLLGRLSMTKMANFGV